MGSNVTVLFLCIFALLNITSCSNSYPYNNFKYFYDISNPYPDNCCKLYWTEINQGDALPKDYISAGEFMDRDWAFTGNKYGWVALKSNESTENPNWMGTETTHRVQPYPVLTNPDKCSIGWYTTKFNREPVPKNPDWFFPPMYKSDYGTFGRYKKVPAKVISNGNIWTLSSLTSYKILKPDHYDLLYVDCKKSAF